LLLVMRNFVTHNATAARRLALRATKARKMPDLVPAKVPTGLTAPEETYRRAFAAIDQRDLADIDAVPKAVGPAEREATHAERALCEVVATSRAVATGVRRRAEHAIDTCTRPSRPALPWRNP
jgi:hypothetical protein